MQAIVTIFKAEFNNNESLIDQLRMQADQVEEVGEAIVFSPKPGQLMDFLGVLKRHGIAYGTHFNSLPEKTHQKLKPDSQ